MNFWDRSEEKKRTFEIIDRYIRETGKVDFTYSELRAWYYGSGAYQDYKRDWHTIERLLRKLAEDGYILRYRWKNTVRFVVPPKRLPPKWIDSARNAFKQARAIQDFRSMNALVQRIAIDLGIDERTAYNLLAKGV